MTAAKRQQRIGLFGGAFDPIHEGHLALARQVLGRCGLDAVLFIPTLQPPHKDRIHASFTHRTAMLRLALGQVGQTKEQQGSLRLSLIEQRLPGPSYSLRTVRALMTEGKPSQYFFLVGADVVLDLHTWYCPQELLRLVSCIVVRRDGVSRAAIQLALQALDPSYRAAAEEPTGRWLRPDGLSVEYLDNQELAISSTEIRAELACGRDPLLLPPAVLAYIKAHSLYAWTRAR